MLFGFLNCDKPVGMTSRDVVNVVQRRIRPIKVGHCGTLDPLARGVLVLGVGPAVRLTSYVQQLQKRYDAGFRLGASSQTGDLENGFVEHRQLPVPTRTQLATAAQNLIGQITQIPPAYSAIWVDGERAYKRARKGEQLQMPSRTVSIERIEILQYQYPQLSLRIACGSGTYIRSLGIDLAKAVGSIAVMTELIRVGVGPFSIDDAVTVDQLRDEPIEKRLVPAAVALSHLPSVIVNHEDAIRLGNGLPMLADISNQIGNVDEAVVLTENGDLRAIIVPKQRGWCPSRVFPIPSASP